MEIAYSSPGWGLSPAGAAGLDRAREGDVEAFGKVCLELEPVLWRYAWGLCGDREMSEDLVQEACIIAWRRLARFDGSCRFLTWVTGILLNLHRNACRKHRPLTESRLSDLELSSDQGSGESPFANLPAPLLSPAEQTLLLERANQVRACLGILPEEQRTVVELRFFMGADLHEIAHLLHCPIGTVKSRLFHALRKLANRPELRELLSPSRNSL